MDFRLSGISPEPFRHLFARFFCDEQVAYLHSLYARRGCFACRVDRMLQ